MKYAWIEAQTGWQPTARLCGVLGVSRSGFLQWRDRGPSEGDLANRSLDAQVAVIHAEGKQGYGRIRVTRRRHQSGMRIGAKRVRKSLLRQSLRTVYRKKYRVTTDSNHRKPVAQNLLDRRFIGWSPNRAWTTDITCLLTDEGWLYLAAIVDLGTRRIVGWAMSERMCAKLVCDALQMAYWCLGHNRGVRAGRRWQTAICWQLDLESGWPIRKRAAIAEAASLPGSQPVTINVLEGDLNGDGQLEILAILDQVPYFCGTHGCWFAVYARVGTTNRWVPVLQDAIAFPEKIQVEQTRTKGYADITMGLVHWKWNGKKYTSN